jgi:hypothetical protein
MNCHGEIFSDCDRDAIATVQSESTMSARELCTEHIAPFLSGDCGTSVISYYSGKTVKVGF